MGDDIVDRPLAAAWRAMQTRSRQTRGKCGNGLWLLFEPGQELVDCERLVVHSKAQRDREADQFSRSFLLAT